MSAMSEIYERARRMVKGIDWNALEREGRGVPLDPEIPAKLGYWVDYLGPAFNQAADVVNTLYYDPKLVNTANTEAALASVYRLLQKSAPGVSAVAWYLDPATIVSNPLMLPAEELRLVMSYIWGVIVYGTKLHTTFAIVAMGRDKWREHADHLVMLCEAIVQLDKFGALNQLKWDSSDMVALRKRQGFSALKPFTAPLNTASPALNGPDGLGVAPLVLIAFGVIGAAVLFYGIYKWGSVTAEINKQTLEVTKEICSDPTYANDPTGREQCVKVLGDALANTTKITPPGSDLTKYLVWAGVAVVGVLFAPQIMRSIKGAIEESRKSHKPSPA